MSKRSTSTYSLDATSTDCDGRHRTVTAVFILRAKHLAYGVLTLVLLAFTPCGLSARCVAVAVEPNDDEALVVKKREYAIAVIRDPQYLANDEGCVKAAMHYLGSMRVNRAIPRLIALLDYRSMRFGHNPDDLANQYPAINALYQVGKPAMPALIQAIAETDSASVQNKNAIFVLMSINREDPEKGIAALTQAADNQSDPQSAERLRKAAEGARAMWCRSVPCGNGE